MNAESLIFRKLTPNEFKAITNTINSEGGGSQTYIDFPKGSISDDDFKEFFGDEGTPNTNGFEWVFYVNSLSIGRVQQKETISARRDSSNSLREQNNENRIEIWKNERSGFPADSYDDKNNPIIVFILKSEDKEFWAGWFYRNDCNDTWPMTKGLSTMFWKDCSYIKFDSPIPFNTHDFRWPFLKNDGIKINIIKMKNLSLQQIYYGAPGTGKSYKTKEVVANYPETVRATFHPDSDYSTFVGAYKPTNTTANKYGLDSVGNTVAIGIEKDTANNIIPFKEKKIEYKFVKQAFLKAYIKAWQLFKKSCVDGQELSPQFLVIEEINRGNCAQIFGDLFQLLDRKNGFSEYPIEADEDIQKAILEEKPEDGLSFGIDGLQFTPEQIIYINKQFDIEGKPSQDVAKKVSQGQVLVLPPNFYIWATMNTSDQSLFPIDSAFKRRWDWVYVPIDTHKEDWYIKVNDIEYSWPSFLDKINDEVLTDETAEDKHLGFYFCKAEDNIISAEKFVSKVLFYLWNDVFKVYGVPEMLTKGDKNMTFYKFYNTDGTINETLVAKLLDNIGVEKKVKEHTTESASDETASATE